MNDDVVKELYALPVHKRFGKRYFRAEDVERLAAAVEECVEDEREAQARLSAMMGTREECEALREECARLKEACSQTEAELEKARQALAQAREESERQSARAQADLEREREQAQAELENQREQAKAELERQLEQTEAQLERERSKAAEALEYSRARAKAEAAAQADEIESLKEELDRVRVRETFLTTDLERKKKELEEYVQFVSSDPVTSAQERAQKILADATAERDRILQEYASQRARVVAATRAAYYNAQQFKMELSRRFSAMEHELDDTIDVLRVLDTSSMEGAANLALQANESAGDDEDDQE